MICQDCKKPLAKDAVKCRCGWIPPIQVQRSAEDFAREELERERREQMRAACVEETRAFMKKEGLETAEDCREYLRRMVKTLTKAEPTFERWASAITQSAVDMLLMWNGEDDKRVIGRLRDICVIDERNRIIPKDERAERLARRRAMMRNIEAELEARGVIQREPGEDSEELQPTQGSA